MLTIDPPPAVARCGSAARLHRYAPSSVVARISRHSAYSQVRQVRFAADAGVVDQDVDPAERLHGRVDETCGRRGIANVGERSRRAPAPGADLLGDGVGLGACALRADEDRGTAVRERERNGAADIPCAPGDDGDAPGKLVFDTHALNSFITSSEGLLKIVRDARKSP